MSGRSSSYDKLYFKLWICGKHGYFSALKHLGFGYICCMNAEWVQYDTYRTSSLVFIIVSWFGWPMVSLLTLTRFMTGGWQESLLFRMWQLDVELHTWKNCTWFYTVSAWWGGLCLWISYKFKGPLLRLSNHVIYIISGSLDIYHHQS